jgi:fatty acid desaturase
MTDDNQTKHSHDDKADRKAEIILLLGAILLLAAWAGSVAIWGIPGLYIPALILVPVVYVLMVWGSFG